MTSLPASTERKLGLVIDLDTCVGCHACVISCKGWNTENYGTPLGDQDAYGADPVGAFLNRVHTYEAPAEKAGCGSGTCGCTPKETPTPSWNPFAKAEKSQGCSCGDTGCGADNGKDLARIIHFPKSCLHCEDAPCVPVCPTGASYKRVEDGIVLVNEDACIGCGLCAWACPYGAREMDPIAKVMKKCTLCVDRIYNENLPEEDRTPACVRTCPAGARHFGDFADPDSNVSILTRERGGFDLMPEQGTKPTNKYLPPRPRDSLPDIDVLSPYLTPVSDSPRGFLGWLDRTLSTLPGGK